MPEIVEWLGYAKAVEFVTIFGGRHIRVPKMSEIAEHVGYAAACVAVLSGDSNEADATREYELNGQRFHKVLERVRLYCESRTEISEFYRKAMRDLGI